ncbi:MAG: bile acid:sodium symporter [Bacteroidaceae bacterium]|nr:bile acid:sodium symporter [Bacteroidaceae bacterium]
MTFLRNWTLPVAIFVGTVFYLVFAYTPSLDVAGDALLPVFETLLPLSIFCTLFITFSKVDFHLMRLRRWHLYILLTQLLLVALLTALTLYIVHCPLSILLLESILICVIAPCASASPVVTAKLGGDLTQMTTFVLLSSVSMALLIPAVFPLLEPREGITFWVAFLRILRRLATVLLLPLLLGAIVRHWVKPLYQWFVRTPDLGFYCWCVSLSITAGLTVRNIVHSHAGSHLLGDIALLTLATAIVQFVIGRLIGRMTGEHICTGQGMFQKNTGLAIWIAYTFLTPEASIGAGCYVLWQNIINSVELWRHRKSGK